MNIPIIKLFSAKLNVTQLVATAIAWDDLALNPYCEYLIELSVDRKCNNLLENDIFDSCNS